MSDLSRSLVDAAAEADWQAHHAEVLKVIGKRLSLDDKKRVVSRVRSQAVVAAVLETLAERSAVMEQAHDGWGVFDADELRQLARAVLGEKEDTDG